MKALTLMMASRSSTAVVAESMLTAEAPSEYDVAWLPSSVGELKSDQASDAVPTEDAGPDMTDCAADISKTELCKASGGYGEIGEGI